MHKWQLLKVYYVLPTNLTNPHFIDCLGLRGLPLITYAPRGSGRLSILYISIAYYMQKGGEGVQIACKNAHVINGRPLKDLYRRRLL